MDLLRRETWLRYGADMLRNRHAMSERKFFSYFGIHSVTVVWLWAFLLPRWPHHGIVLLPQHLLWTLWFLRKYPTEDELLEVTRTSGLVRQVVWSYVTVIAPLLPFVSPRAERSRDLTLFCSRRWRRFEFNEGPRDLHVICIP